MIIVAGAVLIDPHDRDAYLATCVDVVKMARQEPGCLDFALSPDLIDPGRINVYERWTSDEDLQRFRGSGPDAAQQAALLEIRVDEYTVS
jgi:quinol monooxygenase YgiN